MIEAIRRVFRPIGKPEPTDTEPLLHAIRNETQATEAQRWLMQKERETHERTGHDWRDVLMGAGQPPREDDPCT